MPTTSNRSNIRDCLVLRNDQSILLFEDLRMSRGQDHLHNCAVLPKHQVLLLLEVFHMPTKPSLNNHHYQLFLRCSACFVFI